MHLFALVLSPTTQHKAPQLLLMNTPRVYIFPKWSLHWKCWLTSIRRGSSKWCHTVPALSRYGMLFLQPPVMTLMEQHSLQAAEILVRIQELVDRYLIQTCLLTKRDLWECSPPASGIILWPDVFMHTSFHPAWWLVHGSDSSSSRG